MITSCVLFLEKEGGKGYGVEGEEDKW